MTLHELALLKLERQWNGPAIPKVIHQIFRHPPMPIELAANVADFSSQNPGWEHRLYDEATIEKIILSEYNEAMVSVYRSISPAYGAARADLFRYLALYHFGGVYLDVKSRFNRPLDEILRGDEGFVSAYWSNGPGERYESYGLHCAVPGSTRGELQQWHVIAAPGHPFLAAVIREVVARIAAYRPWRDETGKRGVLKLTGPVPYTTAILPLLGEYPSVDAGTEADLSLDYSVMSGNDHVALFKRHYSYSHRPIVQRTGAGRVADSAFWLISAGMSRLSGERWPKHQG